jgi:hypothetical protein
MNTGKSHLKIFFTTLLLGLAIVLTVQIILMAKQHQKVKIDLSEINHIRYGLLNVDEWAEQVAYILTEKINEFEVTPENREQLETSVSNVLYTLIDEVEDLMVERTSGSFSGVKKWIAGFALDMEQLRDSVPSFAHTVVNELDKPETKTLLQKYLNEKLADFTASTYNRDHTELLNELLLKYECDGKEACKELLNEKLDMKQDAINLRVIVLLGVVLLAFLVNLFPKSRPPNQAQSILLILSSLCLLLGGIITPMIELEARIDMLLFQLLGEEVVFRNNILFFQSKSITDMVRILMTDGSFQMISVGILIFTFSIVFPSVKLICSYLYSLNIDKLKKNKLILFFVIKSGKWSMADVMVVAIFMAYIGFNGIVGSQMANLSRSDESIEILTTNGTHLTGGFYLFLCFCLASLFLSSAITRKSKDS